MIPTFVSAGWPARRLGGIVLVGLTMVAFGCGSSEGTTQQGSTPKAAVKEADLFKYVGEGTAKKKVGLTSRERQQARRAARAESSN